MRRLIWLLLAVTTTLGGVMAGGGRAAAPEAPLDGVIRRIEGVHGNIPMEARHEVGLVEETTIHGAATIDEPRAQLSRQKLPDHTGVRSTAFTRSGVLADDPRNG